MLNFTLKVERKLYFPDSSLTLMETFLFFAGRTFFLLLLRANWTSPGVFPGFPLELPILSAGFAPHFARWHGRSEEEPVNLRRKQRACACVRERERTRDREGAREGAAAPRCWVPGCRPPRQHGLRATEAGGARGQQPREDLLHAEEGTSGDQDGQRVRVRAAGLQSGR